MSTIDQLETKYFPAIPGVIRHKENTEVFPWVDGEEYFAALGDAIQGTEGPDDRIYIVNWLFDRQVFVTPNKRLSDLLVEKINLGVDVRVIVWAGRLMTGVDGADPDLDITDPAWWGIRTIDKLGLFKDVVSETNIPNVRGLRALTPLLANRVLMDWSGDIGSRHQKYAVVYRKSTGDLRGFVGIDLSEKNRNPYGGTQTPHEAGFEYRGEAVRSIWRDFKLRWDEVKSLPSKRYMWGTLVEPFNAAIEPSPVPDPSIAIVTPVSAPNSIRVVRTYGEVKDTMLWGDDLPWDSDMIPAGGLREVQTLLDKAVPAATRYIYIEDQGINNGEDWTPHTLVFDMLEAAINKANSDVKVIAVTSGEHDGENLTLTETIWNFFLQRILPKQTNFVMYRVDRMEIHSKVILIDDEFASIGSANFWNRSMNGEDTELNTMIVENADVVKNLRVRLWADHLRVNPSSPIYRPQLLNLDQSLGIFRPGWGTGILPFPSGSKLQLIGPPHPDPSESKLPVRTIQQ